MPWKNNVFIKMQCVIVKNQRVLTENLSNAEGFEYLFFIAGRAGKVDDFIEKNRSSFHQIKIKEGNACEGEHLLVTDLVIRLFHCFFSAVNQ